jgi:hypothetical protein
VSNRQAEHLFFFNFLLAMQRIREALAFGFTGRHCTKHLLSPLFTAQKQQKRQEMLQAFGQGIRSSPIAFWFIRM